MQGDLTPAQEGCGGGQVVAGQRWILGDFPHRHREAIPVHLEPIGIARMGLDLTGSPQEQRIIYVERLAEKRAQGCQRGEGQYQLRSACAPAVHPSEPPGIAPEFLRHGAGHAS